MEIAFIGGILLVVLLYFIYTKVKESQAKKSGRNSGGSGRDTKLP